MKAYLSILLLVLAACSRPIASNHVDISADVCGPDLAIEPDTMGVVKLLDADDRPFTPGQLQGLVVARAGEKVELKVSSLGCLPIPRAMAGLESEIGLEGAGLYRRLPADFLQEQTRSQAALVRLLPPVFVQLRELCGADTLYVSQDIDELHERLVAATDGRLDFTYEFKQDGKAAGLSLNPQDILGSDIPLGAFQVQMSAVDADGHKVLWRSGVKESEQTYQRAPECRVQALAAKAGTPTLMGLASHQGKVLVGKADDLVVTAPAEERVRTCVKSAEKDCDEAAEFGLERPIVLEGEQEICFVAENALGRWSDIVCRSVVLDKEAPILELAWANAELQGHMPLFADSFQQKNRFAMKVKTLVDAYGEADVLRSTLECRVGFLDRAGQKLTFIGSSTTITATCLDGACEGQNLTEYAPCSAEMSFQIEQSYKDVVGSSVVVDVRARDAVGHMTEARLYAGLHANYLALPESLGKKVWTLAVDDQGGRVFMGADSDLSVYQQDTLAAMNSNYGLSVVTALKVVGSDLIVGSRDGTSVYPLTGEPSKYPAFSSETGKIYAIMDRADGLFLAGDNGLWRMDAAQAAWTRVDNAGDDGIYKAGDTAYGILLCQYEGPLSRWDAATGDILPIDWSPEMLAGLSEDEAAGLLSIETIVGAPDGTVWVGTGEGLVHIQSADFSQMTFHAVRNSWSDHSSVYAIAFENVRGGDYTMLLGTNNGLIRWDRQDKFQVYERSNAAIPNNNIRGITRDARGQIWVATEGGAVLLKERDWLHINRDNSSMQNENVASFDFGANGGICAGGDAGMLSCFVKGTWKNFNLLRILGETLRAVRYFGDRFWLSGDAVALLQAEKEYVKHDPLPMPEKNYRTVYDVLKVSGGAEFLATARGLRWRKDGTSKWNAVQTACAENYCMAKRVRQDPKDADLVWYQDIRGFYSLRISTGELKSICRAPQFSQFDVRDFVRVADGRFVIYGFKSGYNQFWSCEAETGKLEELLPDRNGALAKASVRALYFDSAGKLWLGADGALYRVAAEVGMSGERFPFQGIAEAAVNEMKEDATGYMWLATSRGMVRSAKPLTLMKGLDL